MELLARIGALAARAPEAALWDAVGLAGMLTALALCFAVSPA